MMGIEKLTNVLRNEINELVEKGTSKGKELVVTGFKRGDGVKGTRIFIEGYDNKEFLKMNSNSYLGMSIREEVIKAEEEATVKYGAGPGAVRFISGS